jgi:hypothetical protein
VKIKTVITLALTLFCVFSLFWIVRSEVFPKEEPVTSSEPQAETTISTTQPVGETNKKNVLDPSASRVTQAPAGQDTGMLGDKSSMEEPEKTEKAYITAYYFHTTRR